MRSKLWLLSFAVLAALGFSVVPARSQTVVTFDDIPSHFQGIPITNGYEGLTWSNLWVVNALLFSNGVGVTGYSHGMVSPSNVAFNALANPAEIDSLTNFNFFSACFTGAWNSNLNIEVQGYGIGGLLYDTTVVASATSPTLFTFDYLNIDRLCFNSYGGQNAGFGQGAGEVFVMDNFMFEFIPEPSTLLLAVLGVLFLLPVRKSVRPSCH